MIRKLGMLALVLAIAGCAQPRTGAEIASGTKTAATVLVERDVPADWKRFVPKKATVSRTQWFGSASPAVLGTFEKPEDLAVITEGMRTAVKINGMLDVAKSEYDLVLEDKDGGSYTFHLWLGGKTGLKGMYMYVSDTGTGYTMNESITDRLRALIHGLRYEPERAKANGDVVNLFGKITNLDRWKKFVENVNEGTRDEAHFTDYTIEGDPIFRDLLYDGQRIEFTYDNSKDAYGTPDKALVFCDGIDFGKTEQGTRYILTGCDRDNPAFNFTVE
ncbi:DUF4362 domain-containing protein [Cohnella endophytica]|uniref:DUF4362 domain-containing protein n=1 Tax=Cohnella endophytica TaxID=2419778 RepID=A0A494XLX0_9BACL|nr:DUF4362 domain-containing protein [Cohnella endophytica]RKP51697.1 DUF4362 domain-containing protein [Cohnella endophytica]